MKIFHCFNNINRHRNGEKSERAGISVLVYLLVATLRVMLVSLKYFCNW